MFGFMRFMPSILLIFVTVVESDSNIDLLPVATILILSFVSFLFNLNAQSKDINLTNQNLPGY